MALAAQPGWHQAGRGQGTPVIAAALCSLGLGSWDLLEAAESGHPHPNQQGSSSPGPSVAQDLSVAMGCRSHPSRKGPGQAPGQGAPRSEAPTLGAAPAVGAGTRGPGRAAGAAACPAAAAAIAPRAGAGTGAVAGIVAAQEGGGGRRGAGPVVGDRALPGAAETESPVIPCPPTVPELRPTPAVAQGLPTSVSPPGSTL